MNSSFSFLKKNYFKLYSNINLFVLYYVYNLEEYMDRKWTIKQEQAIYEKGNNILVSAAARKWKNSSSCRKNN